MKIGIATCSDKPNLTTGDQALAASLESKSIQVKPLIWNDPNVLLSNWDAIIIRSTWDYHLNSNDFLNWISEIEKSSIRLINSAQVIRWNVDKSYLLELEARGISIVPSALIKKEIAVAQAIEQIQKTGWINFVIKPTISATAYLTFKCNISSSELPSIINQISKHSDILVQPFIPSVAANGEVSLIFFNDRSPKFSHAVIKSPKKGDFRVQSDFGGTDRIIQPSKKLIEFAENCLKMIDGNWCFARVDVIDWEQNPLISELELIEPDLFLTIAPNAIQTLSDVIMYKLSHDDKLNKQ